jgi:parvulin-like peptidyl-prolyl isomerase
VIDVTFASLKHLAAAALCGGLLLAACRGGQATPALNYTPLAPPGSEGEAAGTPPPEGQSAETQPAATVNGVTVSMDAFNRELARFEAGQAALGFQVSDEEGYRQQILDVLIDNELIKQLGEREGIEVTDDQVNAEINSMIEEYGEDYFYSWLQTNYYTPEEFRDVIKVQLMTEQLLPAVVDAVPQTAEHVHARHILVTSEGEAEQVLQQLQNGASFEELAAQHSTDVTTRDRGGDLGWFPRGGLLVPEVEEAAFSLQPGETSGVVASAWGYHIVQTLEYEESRQVDPEIYQRLREQAIEEWRNQLRVGADVQRFLAPSS